MRRLVRRPVKGLIDFSGPHPAVERIFGERHRNRERYTEHAVSRNLDDLQQAVRKRAELRRIVLERCRHAAHHAVDVLALSWIVQNAKRDTAPATLTNRVARREKSAG